MKYLFLFIICLFIFERWSRQYDNPYKVYFLMGLMGCGKTTYIAKKSIFYQKRGRTVYSNVEIPGNIYFEPNHVVGKLSFKPNSVIFIDEVGTIWDNRDFAKFDKAVRDFFVYARQQRLTIYMFSQSYDIDKKIRDRNHGIFLIKRFCRVWSVARKVHKVQSIGHNMEGSGTIIDDYQYASIIDCLLFGGWEWTFIPRWTSYFESYNPPKVITEYNGSVIPMSDIQRRHMKTTYWALDGLSSFLKLVKVKSVTCLDELKKRVKIFFKSHKGSFMRFIPIIRRIALICSRSSK